MSAGGDIRIDLGQRYPALADDLYEFGDLISAATSTFVGRAAVFRALARLPEQHTCGYFRIVADAGLGKTALAAAIAHHYGAAAFFASASRGLTRADQCLKHLCAELIVRLGLAHDYLPAGAGSDSAFLGALLAEGVERMQGPLWVVVDGLDEADPPPPGANPLLLPDYLPAGVYVVLAHRPMEHQLIARPGTPVVVYTIDATSAEQRADVVAHLRRRVADDATIARTLATAGTPVSSETFVEQVAAASAGNFMYLAYVLGDLAAQPAGSAALQLRRLPSGLEGYYAQFWAQMEHVRQEEGWAEWRGLYRPVIEYLAVAGEPVTSAWLADHVGRDRDEIQEQALFRWQRFLSRDPPPARGMQPGDDTWRVVHQSFADFVASKVDLTAVHRAVAD